jgi:PleD family two-component response regulator
MVAQLAVNELVVGSSPTRGAETLNSMISESTSINPMKILIVEDDENQMLTLTQALVKEGYIRGAGFHWP